MLVHRKTRRPGLMTALLLVSLPAVGCGPIAFTDASGIAIVGTAAPEAVPEPEAQKRVEVRDNKIVINEKVQFEFDSHKILPVSHDLLNEVARVIKENPQIKKIEVEGHASSEGSEGHNLRLSDRRANSVMQYLTKQGQIPKAMLQAKGYGVSRPIASNDTEDGREKNRRVEFTILEQEYVKKKVEVGPDGQERIVEEQKVSG